MPKLKTTPEDKANHKRDRLAKLLDEGVNSVKELSELASCSYSFARICKQQYCAVGSIIHNSNSVDNVERKKPFIIEAVEDP